MQVEDQVFPIDYSLAKSRPKQRSSPLTSDCKCWHYWLTTVIGLPKSYYQVQRVLHITRFSLVSTKVKKKIKMQTLITLIQDGIMSGKHISPLPQKTFSYKE